MTSCTARTTSEYVTGTSGDEVGPEQASEVGTWTMSVGVGLSDLYTSVCVPGVAPIFASWSRRSDFDRCVLDGIGTDKYLSI